MQLVEHGTVLRSVRWLAGAVLCSALVWVVRLGAEAVIIEQVSRSEGDPLQRLQLTMSLLEYVAYPIAATVAGILIGVGERIFGGRLFALMVALLPLWAARMFWSSFATEPLRTVLVGFLYFAAALAASQVTKVLVARFAADKP